MKNYILLLSLLMVASTASASIVKFDEHTYSPNSGHDEHSNKNDKNDKKNINGKKNKKQDKHILVVVDHEPDLFTHPDWFQYQDFGRYTKQHDKHDADNRGPDFTGLFDEFTHRGRHQGRPFDFDDHFPGQEFHGDEHGFGYGHDFGHDFGQGHSHGHGHSGGGFEHGQCDVPNPVPVPAAAWLFISGLAGLLRLAHRHRK